MRLALVLTLSTLGLAPAAPALAGDDDLTFDDDGLVDGLRWLL